MKQFFKFLTASCLGTFLALGLIFFFFMMLGVGLSSVPQAVVPSKTILHLKLNNFLPELSNNAEQSPYQMYNGTMVGMNDLNRLIEKAGSDDKVVGILLETENSQIGPAQTIEIISFLNEFKESGKFVEAYGRYFSQSGYAIASVADAVYLNPSGMIDLRGYGMVIPYMKDFSDKTKINFDVYHAGKFKSAIEPYYRYESSDENRFQAHEYLGDYLSGIAEAIGDNRDLPKEKVLDIFDNNLSGSADASLELGLVDGLLYWNDYKEELKDRQDLSKIKLTTLSDYFTANPKMYKSSKNQIAVIYAEGTIEHSGKNKGAVSMETYESALNKVIKSKKIKAVVLRVNSPGGSSMTSDHFWKKIEEIKESGKYVVASFGTYAASGGYYISCGADMIVSEPLCLTGSIGVFSMIPDLSEFFDKQIGINWDTIGTGRHTFIYSPNVKRSADDHAKLMRDTERIYMQFKEKVAEGRGLTVSQVEEIAQGRVWTGQDAVDIGLVDTLGSLADAIGIAADQLELDDYKVLNYPKIELNMYEQLLAEILATQVSIIPASVSENEAVKNFTQLVKSFGQATLEPQVRLPFHIPVY